MNRIDIIYDAEEHRFIAVAHLIPNGTSIIGYSNLDKCRDKVPLGWIKESITPNPKHREVYERWTTPTK